MNNMQLTGRGGREGGGSCHGYLLSMDAIAVGRLLWQREADSKCEHSEMSEAYVGVKGHLAAEQRYVAVRHQFGFH